MHEKIIIAVGKDWDGFTFRLRPKSRQYLKGFGMRTKGLTKRKEPEPLMDQVSISFDEKKKFEDIHGDVYKYVIEMLAGMTVEHIKKIGGVKFVEDISDKIIYEV